MWEMMGAFYCYYILSLFGYTTIHYKLEGRNVALYFSLSKYYSIYNIIIFVNKEASYFLILMGIGWMIFLY